MRWVAACAAAIGVMCVGAVLTSADETTIASGTVAADEPIATSAPSDLTLAGAVELALEHHPRLARDTRRIQEREAETRQASRRPNPELAIEVEDFGGSVGGFGSATTTFSLSQWIELGGKRESRTEEARLREDLATWNERETRLDVVAATVRAFVEALAAQERAALADTLVCVAQEVLVSVDRRVQAGAVSSTESRRASVALETSRVDREHALRSRDSARFRLSSSWGADQPTFTNIVGSLAIRERRSDPALDELLARLDESPRVARFETEAAHRRAVRSAALSSGRPDVSVGAGVRRFEESGDVAFLITGSVPLPLFDRKRDAVHAAEAGILVGEAEAQESIVEWRIALTEAHARLVASAHEASALAERILPEAHAAFLETREAYERGRLRLTEVLEAERTVFELRERRVDALATYHVAVTEIERVLGTPLDEPLLPGDR
jgi:cobalt-zinc-cadmium efflux system outer membrane protein